jgi:hypothetical protein
MGEKKTRKLNPETLNLNRLADRGDSHDENNRYTWSGWLEWRLTRKCSRLVSGWLRYELNAGN